MKKNYFVMLPLTSCHAEVGVLDTFGSMCEEKARQGKERKIERRKKQKPHVPTGQVGTDVSRLRREVPRDRALQLL